MLPIGAPFVGLVIAFYPLDVRSGLWLAAVQPLRERQALGAQRRAPLGRAQGEAQPPDTAYVLSFGAKMMKYAAGIIAPFPIGDNTDAVDREPGQFGIDIGQGAV